MLTLHLPSSLILLLLITLALSTPTPLTNIEERQNTGCYCGSLTGNSCGSRTSSGISLSGSCSDNVVYTCTQRFGNAEVAETCLICDASGQDGFDGSGKCSWDNCQVGPLGP